MNSNTVVRARIDSDTKARATEALPGHGLVSVRCNSVAVVASSG